ncbi:MAG: hypothetical protein IJ150_13745, partial [Bacteroidales bacterium]|nr:hypothetical protein [Bacteroidales bacterium]
SIVIENQNTILDTLVVTAVGDVMLGSIVPDMSYCPPNKGPHIDSQKRVIKVIQDLTKEDINDNLPQISNDGLITK